MPWFAVKTFLRALPTGAPKRRDKTYRAGLAAVEERVVLFRAKTPRQQSKRVERKLRNTQELQGLETSTAKASSRRCLGTQKHSNSSKIQLKVLNSFHPSRSPLQERLRPRSFAEKLASQRVSQLRGFSLRAKFQKS